MLISIEKLEQTSNLNQARSVVNEITVKMNLQFKLDCLQMEEWTPTHLYYTGVTRTTNRVVVLEVSIATKDVFVFREPTEGWIHVGKLKSN